MTSVSGSDDEISANADEDAAADINAKSNEYREERIVNKAGQARNSIKPGSQKEVIMQPQFTNQEPPRTFYDEPSRPIYNTNPSRPTYYEYGNPQQILHRAQDRNDDYNVAMRFGDFLFLN